jgi:hypothetical protein
MADGRKDNGGHSTKAIRPDDKRCNHARKMIERYIREDFDHKKLKDLFDKLYKEGTKGDVRSSTLFLSYILGKPKESIDITSNDETLGNSFNLKDLTKEQIEALLILHGRQGADTDA